MYMYIYIYICIYMGPPELGGGPGAGPAAAGGLLRLGGPRLHARLKSEIGAPDPQLEPQITSLEKCKIS